MLIFEGADFVGKSTLLAAARAEAQRRRWDRLPEVLWRRMQQEPQRWGKLKPDFDYHLGYLRGTYGPLFCDRFTLSELAYGDVYRGGPHPKFTPHRQRQAARAVNQQGGLQLYVDSDEPSARRRMAARGRDEMCLDLDAWHRLRLAYEEALLSPRLGSRGVRTIRIENVDVSDDVLERCLEKRLDWALCAWRARLLRAEELHRALPQSWGAPFAPYLLVGERVGGDRTGSRPFNGAYGCSEWLSTWLDEADVGEDDLYLANAYRGNGDPLLTSDGVRVLAPRRVVALGKLASKRLEELEVPHVDLPHPQYLFRFENKEVSKWATRLRDALR